MAVSVGIRREDKNEWERRVPLIPEHLQELTRRFGARFIVQPQANRAFSDEEFADAGAVISDDLAACDLIMAIKEIPEPLILPRKVYLFFSHTAKGQRQNMPMLRRLLQLGCTLIDCELIADEEGRRLVFFGRHAGIAGMIDALYSLGVRLRVCGIDSPFDEIRQTYRYASQREAEEAIARLGRRIRTEGLPPLLRPFVCGIAGYGNVAAGVQQILDLLPTVEIAPQDLPSLPAGDGRVIYKTIFREQHTVESRDGSPFDLETYRRNPQRFRSAFGRYLPFVTVLINAVYWDERFPRLVERNELRHIWPKVRLRLIADISCDLNGAVEITERTTTPAAPFFIYGPPTDTVHDNVDAPGLAVMAVDNLPGELARESSTAFSTALMPLMPALLTAAWPQRWEDCVLPAPLRNAVVAYRGRLTPKYAYLEEAVRSGK